MKSVLLGVFLAMGSGPQDQPSIIESAKRNGGRANLVIEVYLPAFSLATVVPEAELIVRATIRSSVPALSHDKSKVMTELKSRFPISFGADEGKRRHVVDPGS